MEKIRKARKMSQPSSLVTSLVRSALLWAVPGLIITALALAWLSRNSTYAAFDEPLESTVLGLIANVDVSPDGSMRLSRELPDERYQRALSGRYWVIGSVDADNNLISKLSSRSLYGANLRISPPIQQDLSDQSQEPTRFITDGPDVDANETLRVIARQVLFTGQEDPVIVLAAADRAPVGRSVRNFAIATVLLLAILTLGLILAVYTQVRLGLRPLFNLVNRIADVREGRAVEVEGVYPTEIAPLAGELNSLISHNKSVVERAQTHVGNLAHAIKTPLAVLRNEAGMDDITDSSVVARQTELMTQQVDHHLRRARAAARGQAIGVRTEMDPVIDGLVRTLPRIYREKDLQISRTGETGLIFRGAHRDLEDMIGNLMDNAAKWTHDKIMVSIDLTEDGFCLVSVEDNGPGLTPEEYKTAILRGARLDEATPGSGLGLSIVDDLAQAYKGSFSFDKSRWGGLKAILNLPIAKEI